MLDREVELPWAAELGRGREAQEDGLESPLRRRRRMPAWPLVETDRSSGPQRGGLEAKLFLSEEEAVVELDAELELEVDDAEDESGGDDDYDDYYDDFDGMDECEDIVELGTL